MTTTMHHHPYTPWTTGSLTHRQLACLRPLPPTPSVCHVMVPQGAARFVLCSQSSVSQDHQSSCEPSTNWSNSSSSCTSRSSTSTVPYPATTTITYSSSFNAPTSPKANPPAAASVETAASKEAIPVGSGGSRSRRTQSPTSPGGGPGPWGDDGGGGDDEFGPNFGEAVEVLREDLPRLFEQDPRYHIYREDITFRTPSMRYSTGLWKYRLLHTAARWLGNLLYADMQLSLTRMWQPAGNRKQLRVRWCVSGRARLSLSADDKPVSTEVISTYTFDSRGKIYEHQVDQIIPPESPLVQLLEWLMGKLQPGVVAQPQLPLPGLRDGMGSTRMD